MCPHPARRVVAAAAAATTRCLKRRRRYDLPSLCMGKRVGSVRLLLLRSTSENTDACFRMAPDCLICLTLAVGYFACILFFCELSPPQHLHRPIEAGAGTKHLSQSEQNFNFERICSR